MKLWWKLFKFGFPSCCVYHARHYCMVIYDVGDQRETSFKMSLS
jgi:hypothetical protein